MNNCPLPKYGVPWTLGLTTEAAHPGCVDPTRRENTEAYSPRSAGSDPGILTPDDRASGAAVWIALGGRVDRRQAQPAEDP